MSLGGIDSPTSKADFLKQAAENKPKKGPSAEAETKSVMGETSLVPKDLMKADESNSLQPSRKLDTKA